MQIELGSDMYLFTREGQNHAAECVISAHGGWYAACGEFNVPPNTTLCFYCQDGESADDFGMVNWRTTAYEQAQEIFTAGDRVKNYFLTKYQGGHNQAGETYQVIDATVNSIETKNQDRARVIASGLPYFGNGHANPVDVATVRNRKRADGRTTPFGTGLLLQDVVERLLSKHPYRLFHCFFCRNHIHNRAMTWMADKVGMRKL